MSGADLTVKDGLQGGSGSIANESSTNYDATGVYVGSAATFNLVSGSVEVNAGFAIYNIGGTVAISGGHVVGGSVTSQSGRGVSHRGRAIKQATLSIQSYCESTIDMYKSSQDAKERALADLCKATLDYGTYAQRAFGHRIDDLANGGTDNFVNADIQVPASALAVSGLCAGIAGSTFSLLTTSRTQLVVYFKHAGDVDKDGYTFTVEGKAVDAVDANGKFAVTVEGISAKNLGDRYTIMATCNADGSSVSVNVSPLDYISVAVAKEKQPEVSRALYNYHLKAKEFLG